jgi:hypothetical protein
MRRSRGQDPLDAGAALLSAGMARQLLGIVSPSRVKWRSHFGRSRWQRPTPAHACGTDTEG